MKLSAIILSRTTSESIFEMTSNCISTLIESEKNVQIEVILVESNKQYSDSNFRYPDFVKVIIPEADFNFHQFLNIGAATATGDFIALCNNDLIFHNNWFSEILKVARANPKIASFSPVGSEKESDGSKTFEIGYKVMTHIKGWCLVIKNETFKKIGPLDQTFDFYYADNDYAMTLRSQNIPHALVYRSLVNHLEKKTVKGNLPEDLSFVEKYHIPAYMKQEKYRWVFGSEKALSGFLKFHSKWGSPDWLYKKNKLADILKNYHLQFLIPFFFKMK